MNYIRHLNGFFQRLERDKRMNSYHISLYLSCFQIWNLNRFKNPISVNRFEMMRLSRIGSVNTYARCIKQLHAWGYIEYFPSANLHIGSTISCIRFDITSNTGSDTTSDTLLINITNKNKEGNANHLKKGIGKNRNEKNRLNANLDKDYSEPL